MRFEAEYALITGASSGIGLELAHVFAQHNHNVVLTARSEQKLNQLKNELTEKYKIQAEVVVCDLSKPNASDEIFSVIKKNNWNIKYLINNAGLGETKDFLNNSSEIIHQMLQVNIIALTELTHMFVRTLPVIVTGKQIGRAHV